jgi:hypothetical protein
MNSHTRVFLAFILPLVVGCVLLLPVINSDNGYVAGFVFLPLFLLVLLLSIVLFVASLIAIGVKGRPGMWWLPSGPLVFAGFFCLAVVAKQFEIGAYKEDPMVSFPPPIANKAVFKPDATEEEIDRFWTHIIGYPDEQEGMSFRPGILAAARSGNRVITFAFRDDVTDKQKNDVRERIKNYEPVFQYLENVSTSSYEPNDESNTKKPINAREPTKLKVANSTE